MSSFASDMSKHEETATLIADMGALLMREALAGPDSLRKFIEGFAE